MKPTIRLCLLVTTFALSSTITQAETGFYIGAGLGYSSGNSIDGPRRGRPRTRSSLNKINKSRAGRSGAHNESVDSAAVIGLTLGYRFEKGNAFYGPELDIDIFSGSDFSGYTSQPCSVVAYSAYFCERNSTVRLRGIYGQRLNGGLEWFATAGIGIMHGKVATGPRPAQRESASATGYTIGLGLQKAIKNGARIRGEIIYDNFGNSSRASRGRAQRDYTAVTAKISYIYSF